MVYGLTESCDTCKVIINGTYPLKLAVQQFFSSFLKQIIQELSHLMRKPTICICQNIGADRLRSNCEADQRLSFRFTDSTITLLSKSKISNL